MKAKLKAKPSTKHSISQCMCLSSGPSKKIGKTKISKKRKLLGSGSSAAEDELKRKVGEEAAAKARAEEEDAIKNQWRKQQIRKLKKLKERLERN
ncbi:hypothetical protein Tco_0272358 [Tanacetum coccineum]